jgi:phenylpyruvate tautomerase PptA (4-oxalocrotonate tautomerase family)
MPFVTIRRDAGHSKERWRETIRRVTDPVREVARLSSEAGGIVIEDGAPSDSFGRGVPGEGATPNSARSRR